MHTQTLNLIYLVFTTSSFSDQTLDKSSLLVAPPHTNWTHRYKESGQPADYQLYDQIWVSNALAGRVAGAWIYSRKYLTEEGSDHDPARIELRCRWWGPNTQEAAFLPIAFTWGYLDL